MLLLAALPCRSFIRLPAASQSSVAYRLKSSRVVGGTRNTDETSSACPAIVLWRPLANIANVTLCSLCDGGVSLRAALDTVIVIVIVIVSSLHARA